MYDYSNQSGKVFQRFLKDQQVRLCCWIRALIERSCINKAAVALANKTVRTAWAMLRHQRDYDAGMVVTLA